MGRRILILWFAFCMSIAVHAQTDTLIETVTSDDDYSSQTEEVYEMDTILRIHKIDFPKDSIRNWKARGDFSYVDKMDSLLKASQVQRTNVRIPSGPSFMTRLLAGSALQTLFWVIAIAFIGIIVYQLLLSRGIFRRSSKLRVAEMSPETEELLLHSDFDRLANEAIAAGNFRLAVRYLFLKALQQLRDANHINYEPDKTNTKYIQEIPLLLKEDFSRLALQYEYVWYGNFEINESQFMAVQKAFTTLTNKV